VLSTLQGRAQVRDHGLLRARVATQNEAADRDQAHQNRDQRRQDVPAHDRGQNADIVLTELVETRLIFTVHHLALKIAGRYIHAIPLSESTMCAPSPASSRGEGIL
jgi:hypothetical protein